MSNWNPPAPPVAGVSWLVAVDPRVQTTRDPAHPCPSNPPPPAGWRYWTDAVPREGTAMAVTMLHDAQTYPMGAFVQAWIGGQLVGARVEWHTEKAATGERGCFRGVNLMAQLLAQGAPSSLT